MSKVNLIPKYEEKNGMHNGPAIDKIYTVDGIEIVGKVSPYAVAPLRILTHVLSTKGIDYKIMLSGNNPWAIEQLIFEDKNITFVKTALEEIMKYRCAVELGDCFDDIIRQLPFEVAMRTSDSIINNSEIPKNEQVLKKHLIYPSIRGGYNIKTRLYSDSSLDHYCHFDSQMYD